MDTKTLKSIVEQIHRRFPDVSGAQPKVTRQSGASQAKSGPTYLLTFHSTNRTSASAQSKAISRWVRVVVTEQGKIMKVTTSR